MVSDSLKYICSESTKTAGAAKAGVDSNLKLDSNLVLVFFEVACWAGATNEISLFFNNPFYFLSNRSEKEFFPQQH